MAQEPNDGSRRRRGPLSWFVRTEASRSERSDGGQDLVAECEAFLSGHLAEEVERHAHAVPHWAWTNLLAHGSLRDLRVERAMCHPPEVTAEAGWRDARSYLAGAVLDLVDCTCSLEDLQAIVLVPLELQLAARDDVGDWQPERWVGFVEALLDEQRHVHGR